ncbi:LLM class flavin-dependent oxidoreductase [Zavarzinia sp. CC-PAN008]|uniref:LLM class flavin-dependent oxidoreductase n=1 Tax=Zavarzinia sp. CC-PAN008 TaxID=3243332 RepID=UPI003F7451B7
MNAILPRQTLAPRQRLLEKPFLLGLFLPLHQGGWTPSDVPRGTTWTFDYNAGLVREAERLGFDFTFGFASWLNKGGFGGRTGFRANSIDSLISTAGLAAITQRLVLISTVHVLYGWHPLHLARFGATLDHMTGGRWGVNVVTGYKPGEIEMFGLKPIPHDRRYELADEFITLAKRLWEEDADLTHRGETWSVENAYVSPRPVHGRPLLVSAAASDAGFRYAARHSDVLFITSPTGAGIDDAVAALPALTARIRELAQEQGRTVRTVINPHVIARETQGEAEAAVARIIAGADEVALDAVQQAFTSGDQQAWRGHSKAQRIVGGNIQIVGTPEKVVADCLRLKAAGVDGIQVNFLDYGPDLQFFGERVLPLLKQAGLHA